TIGMKCCRGLRKRKENRPGAVRSDSHCIRDAPSCKSADGIKGHEVEIARMKSAQLSAGVQLPRSAPVAEIHVVPIVHDERCRGMRGQLKTGQHQAGKHKLRTSCFHET